MRLPFRLVNSDKLEQLEADKRYLDIYREIYVKQCSELRSAYEKIVEMTKEQVKWQEKKQ